LPSFEEAMKRPNERNSMKHSPKNSNFYSIHFLHLLQLLKKINGENDPPKEK